MADDVEFRLTILSSGAALVEWPRDEVARLLRDAAESVDEGADSGTLRDFNGNAVGTWSLQVP